MQNAHGLTITISPNVKIHSVHESTSYLRGFGSGSETVLSEGFLLQVWEEWVGAFLSSCEMPCFSLIFVSLESMQGGFKKKKKVEKNMRRKSWVNLFFSCCVFPGPQGTPPATAIQTLYWSYFHWIIRTHLPLTGLWTSHLSTSRNSKKLQNSFQHDFHSATHGSGFQYSF